MKIVFTSDTHAAFSSRTDAKHVNKFLPGIAAEKPDLVIHAGDWGTSQPKHVERAFRQFREALGDVPIVGVLGNHDYWDRQKKFYNFGEVQNQVKGFANLYAINILDGESVVFDNGVGIFGFMGWYAANPKPLSNDHWHIPEWEETDTFLRDNALKNFKNLTQMEATPHKHLICVTHFPPYSIDPKWGAFCANQTYFDPLCEKYDYLLVGHNHQDQDFNHLGCRVMTCGSDYDQPKYKVIELP